MDKLLRGRLALFPLICILSALVFSGCEGAKKDFRAQESLKLARILYKERAASKEEAYISPEIRKNAEKAFLKYQAIVKHAPSSEYVAEALAYMARIRDEFGPSKEAIKYWLKLIYDYPDSSYTREADERLKKVIKKWLAAANNHVYRERYNEAIFLYKQVLKVNAYNAEARLALGNAFIKSSRYDEGVREFQRAVEIDPNYIEAHYLLGLVYLAKGQNEAALEKFQAVTEIKSTLAAAYYNIALIYQERLKDKKKARIAWEEYRKMATSLEKEQKWLPTAEYNLKSF